MKSKDILEILEEEHDEVRNLIEMAQEGSGPTRERLLNKIVYEWVPHSLAEEKVLYSQLHSEFTFEDSDRMESVIEESYRDHYEASAILKVMRSLDRDSEDWEMHLMDLKSLIDDHIEEEEDTLFPIVRRALTREKLETMSSQYLSYKKQYIKNNASDFEAPSVAVRKPAAS